MSGVLEQLLATPAWLTLLVVFALPALGLDKLDRGVVASGTKTWRTPQPGRKE